MNAVWAVLLLAAACACSAEAQPRPEWVVSVSTDAPLPQLGDRLLVETLTSDGQLACEGCRRVLSASSVSDFPISFSIVPDGRELLLRTRLYRTRVTGVDGLPTSDQLIDAIGLLPETAGRRELTVNLALACFGVPADLAGARACASGSGELAAIAPLGLEAPLTPVSSSVASAGDCGANPPPGTRCIPGGLFVRGDGAAVALDPVTDPAPEHLTRLRSFFLDEDEVTVGLVRELIARRQLSAQPTLRSSEPPARRSCTYLGPRDASNDALPLNCLPGALASEICGARGMRLPTEAEWEYAAGNRDEESLLPWGADATTICAHAVVGRVTFFGDELEGSGVCTGQEVGLSQPIAGGNPLDVTQLGIRNLGGNLSEIVADACGSYAGPCWPSSRILDNPRCDVTDVPDFPAARRGGSWLSSLLNVPAAARSCVRPARQGDPSTGFRCAMDAE